MRSAVAIVRGWDLVGVAGDEGEMNAASLVKQVLSHIACCVLDDLDAPIWQDVTARHVLSHTTGLPNWRSGDELVPLRPPGQRWGYSGEGFVLLQGAIEDAADASLGEVASDLVFEPLQMRRSRFDEPEPGYHGYRPLITTAHDYGTFLAHTLAVHDDRWRPQWVIDDQLAWGLGWGLELDPPVHGWQWGANPQASNFVLGCPERGDGVVVFTDAPGGTPAYRQMVEKHMPGRRAALDAFTNPSWLDLFA